MTREHEALPLLPPRRPTYAPARSRIDGDPEEKYGGLRAGIAGGDWAWSENLHRIRDHADKRSNPIGGKDVIAAAVGGQTITATVTDSVDTRVPHRLGRIPQAIVHVEGTGNPADRLEGRPEGGHGSTGGNETAWTSTDVFLRSNVVSPGRSFVFTVA
jgi:hypothetical protein